MIWNGSDRITKQGEDDAVYQQLAKVFKTMKRMLVWHAELILVLAFTGCATTQNPQSRVIAKNHFRMEQAEAVWFGWSMKLLRAVQRRSVKASVVRAI